MTLRLLGGGVNKSSVVPPAIVGCGLCDLGAVGKAVKHDAPLAFILVPAAVCIRRQDIHR